MKLRNKKTGRIANFRRLFFDEPEDDRENYHYSSLAEFNAEWEDYTPQEPLIKDEKICKAVRAWAEANAVQKADFEYIKGDGSILSDFCGTRITFYDDLGLTSRETYTIAELCGEEEK